ncbi:MAG: hypothetical protein ACOCYE_05360 [Pseudomonadota bacterium]
MVFYVIRKLSPPAPREECHGPYESRALAQAKAKLLASAAKLEASAYEVVCDFG